ncbi:MAG: hypothetical protein HY865_24735 [Chloroflexi bacterium]|nr:hypothetical protein [Chloroflexota bacterium]
MEANMNALQKEHPYSKEFGDFIKFLQSLWGILAEISVFFPLSNVLLKAIPLGYAVDDSLDALEYLSPALVTTLVTVPTIFIILQTFRQDYDLRTSKQKIAMPRLAWISFGLGAPSLLPEI